MAINMRDQHKPPGDEYEDYDMRLKMRLDMLSPRLI